MTKCAIHIAPHYLPTMLWNCPHCQLGITPKTIKSERIADVANPAEQRRVMRCPHCDREVEMNIHPAEYWQVVIPGLGLFALWIASRNDSTASMVMAAIVVGGGLVATLYIRNKLLGLWQRLRAPSKPD